MKANRKFVEGEEAVSAVIGVILMVAITVAIAATAYVYVSGMLWGGPTASPTVGLVQTANYLQIQRVDGGPLSWGSVYEVLVNATGVNESSATFAENDNDGDGYISGGDTITIGGTLTGGAPYTLTLIYGADSIGTCEYIPV